MVVEVPTTETRRPGRPRSEAADRAILRAAMEEYAERGYDGLTVEAVAARAGVSKATIYRRYASKADLVIASAQVVADETPLPDTGSVRGDFRALLADMRRLLSETPVGRAARALVGDASRHPELAALHREFVAQRRAGTVAIARRGIERGELVADADPSLVTDLVVGPVLYRHLVGEAPIDDAYLDALLDATLSPLVRR